MYELELEAIDKIFHKDGYINLVINDFIKKNNFDEKRKNLFTKIVYGVVENKILLDYQLSFYLKSFFMGWLNCSKSESVFSFSQCNFHMFHFTITLSFSLSYF